MCIVGPTTVFIRTNMQTVVKSKIKQTDRRQIAKQRQSAITLNSWTKIYLQHNWKLTEMAENRIDTNCC